jgi:hypothetical protein
MFEPDTPCVPHPFDQILAAIEEEAAQGSGAVVKDCGEQANLSQYIGVVGYSFVWAALLFPCYTGLQ